MKKVRIVVLLLIALLLQAANGAAQPAVRFDFARGEDCQLWQPLHDIASLQSTAQGLRIDITGNDPYLAGPARDFAEGQPLWLRLRLKSDDGGSGQVFYFQQSADEEHSVRFAVRPGMWEELLIPLPSLGPRYRFRLDPPGSGGTCLLASLACEPRVHLAEPNWPRPVAPSLSSNFSLKSGELELLHNRQQFDSFCLRVAGESMGCGLTQPLVGYLTGTNLHWLAPAERARVTVETQRGNILSTAVFTDDQGASWRWNRRFSPGREGTITCAAEVMIDQDRQVVFLPLLVLLPGVGSFGETKHQGLFCGLEYLDNEPSSSEADLVGPGAQRQVPDSLKITIPLMAIEQEHRYVGLTWNPGPELSALFDSPDRRFHSQGHVLGILFPGSDGLHREEGRLLPYSATKIVAGKPLRLEATLLGGTGSSVVPAIQKYVALRGLPSRPKTGEPRNYLDLAAKGWLDSAIRQEALFRHATPGAFGAQPAADAAWMMNWLAVQTTNATLARRLRETAQQALANVIPAQYNFANVGHERMPVAALLYGHVAGNAAQARATARALLSRFDAHGMVLYRAPKDQLDYGKTHFARHANGLTAPIVAQILECATICGDPDLIQAGLQRLSALDPYANSVPRGAQTWEIPLHTPDILASAHLVRAYTLGYEITGQAHFLDSARYWAWTGVPFVYLRNPTDQPVGPYATIAVLGATQWKAPNWMGLPVQWCGLVYADALYRFQRYDPSGPWQRLADGITASGWQQTYPLEDQSFGGLLPDSYNLRSQSRNPANINPGTLQVNAIRLLDLPEPYALRVFRQYGAFVHAPGAITQERDRNNRCSFTVQGWRKEPYYVLISGLKSEPKIRVNGQKAMPGLACEYQAKDGWLILKTSGHPRIEIRLP